MRINTENKDSVDKLHLLSGEKKKTVRNFLESLTTLIILNYLENTSTNIPFFGTFKIKQIGNHIDNDGKEAVIDIEFKPEESFLRSIGQIEDGEECDIVKLCKTRIRNAVSNYIS